MICVKIAHQKYENVLGFVFLNGPGSVCSVLREFWSSCEVSVDAGSSCSPSWAERAWVGALLSRSWPTRFGALNLSHCIGDGAASAMINPWKSPQSTNVFCCHRYPFFCLFFLVLNAANVLNKKCSNESSNNLFLSSVSWSLKILQFIYRLVYSSYYNIFFFRQHHFVNSMKP